MDGLVRNVNDTRSPPHLTTDLLCSTYSFHPLPFTLTVSTIEPVRLPHLKPTLPPSTLPSPSFPKLLILRKHLLSELPVYLGRLAAHLAHFVLELGDLVLLYVQLLLVRPAISSCADLPDCPQLRASQRLRRNLDRPSCVGALGR